MTPREKSEREKIVQEYLIFENEENRTLDSIEDINQALKKLGLDLQKQNE